MTDESTSPRKRFGFLALFIVLTLGFLGGGLAVVGVAAHHIHGWGGWGGHHHMDGSPAGQMDPARRQVHVRHMVDMLSWKIDATPEQKQKLTAIADGIAKEIEPVHQKFFDAHKRLHGFLLQPTTDRAALEALRVEQLALADEVSKKLVQALADASDVLTPAQRTKLAQGWDF